MRSFEYCIWLLPNNDDLFIFKDKLQFQPHITVQSDISSLPEAFDIYDELEHEVNAFQVTLGVPSIAHTIEKDFYSYQYNLIFNQQNVDDSPPAWWNNFLHISVAYKYNDPLTIEEIPHELQQLSGFTLRFDKIGVSSTGKGDKHYKEWKLLHTRDL